MKSKIIPACIAIASLSYLPSALCSEQNQVDSQPWLKPETSPHKVFMTADSSSGEQFDVWQMDTGYAYSVMDNVDLYVATRISNAGDNTPSRGFLSGVNYHFSEKLSVNSAIYTAPSNSEGSKLNEGVSAEVSGKYMLTDTLNLKATLEHEEWQSGIEVKLGFSF
ncbi:hypothetical protein JCM19232_1878 [Vibrio ishigakensis]|uniref:Uncharacterized protein n=1 Tax=Vibrio ishigakensis TaxID=1481914 RepID=A0A0B8NJA4_9VIBR|nr:hypothetical protein [Vibrio ishigakensis]GAM54236.1 hypothetical protein JCM19231_228 [Vibrio ishigakensis]GAM62721.1 hypothetical protein JCM19232_1878 [Vibrio ishigakensis]